MLFFSVETVCWSPPTSLVPAGRVVVTIRAFVVPTAVVAIPAAATTSRGTSQRRRCVCNRVQLIGSFLRVTYAAVEDEYARGSPLGRRASPMAAGVEGAGLPWVIRWGYVWRPRYNELGYQKTGRSAARWVATPLRFGVAPPHALVNTRA